MNINPLSANLPLHRFDSVHEFELNSIWKVYDNVGGESLGNYEFSIAHDILKFIVGLLLLCLQCHDCDSLFRLSLNLVSGCCVLDDEKSEKKCSLFPL